MQKIFTFLSSFINEFWFLLLEMSPYLILGFVIAGIIHVFLPQHRIDKMLGGNNTKSVVNAAVFGIPLPLCSCGVLPTGISFHQNGASKGAAVSFLISTPQTGVDSVLVTYSLLGLPFALIRPVVAFVTGIVGGIVTNQVIEEEKKAPEQNVYSSRERKRNPLMETFHYAFVEFMMDIAKWIVIGLLIAAAISAIVPDNFFQQHMRNDLLGMLVILVVSIPLYVCATSSVPIAAVLMMKGLSPGAALVFLMAGPATNAATITVIGKAMGRKALISYLASIIAGALAFGVIIDYLLPSAWFEVAMLGHHHHDVLPLWLQLGSAAILVISILNIFRIQILKKLRVKKPQTFTPVFNMNEIKVTVKGMTCQHCKANVENSLSKAKGVEKIFADIDREEVIITGQNVSKEEIKNIVEGIGYQYIG